MASIKAHNMLIRMPTVSGARCAHLFADWTSRSTAMGQAAKRLAVLSIPHKTPIWVKILGST